MGVAISRYPAEYMNAIASATRESVATQGTLYVLLSFCKPLPRAPMRCAGRQAAHPFVLLMCCSPTASTARCRRLKRRAWRRAPSGASRCMTGRLASVAQKPSARRALNCNTRNILSYTHESPVSKRSGSQPWQSPLSHMISSKCVLPWTIRSHLISLASTPVEGVRPSPLRYRLKQRRAQQVHTIV